MELRAIKLERALFHTSEMEGLTDYMYRESLFYDLGISLETSRTLINLHRALKAAGGSVRIRSTTFQPFALAEKGSKSQLCRLIVECMNEVMR